MSERMQSSMQSSMQEQNEHVDGPETTSTGTTIGRMTGMVKWFNNKSGFGFITVCSESAYKGTDIFVHYSKIRVSNSQYKFLIQGEYVDFDLISNDTGTHKFNASDVCGVNNGPIMCETRKNAFDQSTSRESPQQDRRYTVRPASNQSAAVDDGFKPVRRLNRPSNPSGTSGPGVAKSRQFDQRTVSRT